MKCVATSPPSCEWQASRLVYWLVVVCLIGELLFCTVLYHLAYPIAVALGAVVVLLARLTRVRNEPGAQVLWYGLAVVIGYVICWTGAIDFGALFPRVGGARVNGLMFLSIAFSPVWLVLANAAFKVASAKVTVVFACATLLFAVPPVCISAIRLQNGPVPMWADPACTGF